MSLLEARRRKREAEGAPDWMRNIRHAERGYHLPAAPLAHLRDVYVPDEYAFADWAWKMREISPVFSDFYEDQQFWQRMGVFDSQVYGGLTEAFPGSAGVEIGRMPQGMLMGLLAYDPDILHDRERLYAFLRARPEFQSPGAPVASPWDPTCKLKG